jgi:hypothetical protein
LKYGSITERHKNIFDEKCFEKIITDHPMILLLLFSKFVPPLHSEIQHHSSYIEKIVPQNDKQFMVKELKRANLNFTHRQQWCYTGVKARAKTPMTKIWLQDFLKI